MLSPARSAWCTKKLNSTGTLIQTTTTEAPQGHMYYIGLDVHKKTISYCVKDASGQIHQEGKVGATRRELDSWIKTLPQPRTMAMEATIFTGWIYDHLLPHAQQVKVAHPLMLRAIAAAKKKNDRIDAGKIADCLRCDFLPECHMASTPIRDRRRTLRYRHLLVRQMVQMKNRISGLLMETGASHNKKRLHKIGYFRELLSANEEVQENGLADHGVRIYGQERIKSMKAEEMPGTEEDCWRNIPISPPEMVGGVKSPGISLA